MITGEDQTMREVEKLQEIRNYSGTSATSGLSMETISRFIALDSSLRVAIDDAYDQFQAIKGEFATLLKLPEKDQIASLQEGIVNFYEEDALNPYVPIAAKGPWIITTCGAVIHDSGGYGMLGFGHGPDPIVRALDQKQVMANIMTASLSQKRLVNLLNREIGRTRKLSEPVYGNYLFLNSGSEAVTVACRFSDINAFRQTTSGERHHRKTIKFLALTGGFHGRTDRPSQVSHSSIAKYRKSLATFRELTNLVTVDPNDTAGLEAAFKRAEREGVFFEAVFMEPVMGEGNPGLGIKPAFYQAARELTRAHGSLLIVDSIQAGLRAHGCLSIVDYPGFEKQEYPDMETFSKALNAGQYPLSVLALGKTTANLYVKGVYGNTMTANPRSLDVACAVLQSLGDDIRRNIQDRGREFCEKMGKLMGEFPGVVTKVQGTGLLFSVEINGKIFKVLGPGGLERYLRVKGIGVIHGGENSLRFTPHFRITSNEVDLVVNAVRDAIKNAPRL
jgi:acetylornithine/succinyldiaminopimelate/putrescine aminotransferase